LLLRGAPTKRIWANKLNGIGGHIEPGETPIEGACREIREETGLAVEALDLRAIVHVDGNASYPGVILFVYTGQALTHQVCACDEGTLGWYPLDELPWAEMVEDLKELLPLLLEERSSEAAGHIIYGNYVSDQQGRVHFRFEPT
jgi:8-oxo-dGTP diphosphatase